MWGGGGLRHPESLRAVPAATSRSALCEVEGIIRRADGMRVSQDTIPVMSPLLLATLGDSVLPTWRALECSVAPDFHLFGAAQPSPAQPSPAKVGSSILCHDPCHDPPSMSRSLSRSLFIPSITPRVPNGTLEHQTEHWNIGLLNIRVSMVSKCSVFPMTSRTLDYCTGSRLLNIGWIWLPGARILMSSGAR